MLVGAVVFLLPAAASGRPSMPSDMTPPNVTPIFYGALGTNGWYVSNVTLNWLVQDPESPILESHGCDAVTLVADTVGTSFTCYARSEGGANQKTVTIKRDATPPTVTIIPDRAPDANGWYNQPVAFTWNGADPTSAIEVCSRITYGGPDDKNASVAGMCRDHAGNVTSASATFQYDATPPKIKKFDVEARKAAALLRWRGSADAKSVELLRVPGLEGAVQSSIFRGTGSSTDYVDRGLRPGRAYRYQLTVADDAANKRTKTLQFVARGALLEPAPGEQVSKPPLLVWTAVRGASYYNVVLVRGRRVFSAWPLRSRLKLQRAWTYHGRRYKLRPGTYRWYVWPGRGRFSAGRYGKLLGASSFVVTR